MHIIIWEMSRREEYVHWKEAGKKASEGSYNLILDGCTRKVEKVYRNQKMYIMKKLFMGLKIFSTPPKFISIPFCMNTLRFMYISKNTVIIVQVRKTSQGKTYYIIRAHCYEHTNQINILSHRVYEKST